MPEYITEFTRQSLAHIEYTRVNEEQAEHVRSVLERPEYSKSFDVSFLPVETSEERQAAAEEWAAYKAAASGVRAHERGAVMVLEGQDDSVENLLALLEDKDAAPEDEGRFVTHALMRVIKRNSAANVFDLISGYYRPRN